MACRKTWWRKCVPSDRGIYNDRRVRIIIECPERILHLEAGYIYADRLFASSTLLQSGGGPYIFAIYFLTWLLLRSQRPSRIATVEAASQTTASSIAFGTPPIK